MDYTYQEIVGLVNMIYFEELQPTKRENLVISPQFFNDWELALYQLTNSESLGIDNRKRLTKNLLLKTNTLSLNPAADLDLVTLFFVNRPRAKVASLSTFRRTLVKTVLYAYVLVSVFINNIVVNI